MPAKFEINPILSQAHFDHLPDHAHETKFPCTTCDKVYDLDLSLRKHTVDCGREKDLVCKTCGWKTKVQKKLWEHRKQMHSGDYKNKRRCKNCNAVFDNFKSLTRHYRMDHGVLPYMCESCPLSFVTESSLTNHRRNIHENLASWKCGVCDMKFKHRQETQKHVASHFDKPIYRCTECLLDFGCMATGYIHIKKTHGKGNANLKLEESEGVRELREKNIIRIDGEKMPEETRSNTRPLKKMKT